MEEFWFPKFDYFLDESNPDLVILRRQDRAFVAAFSASDYAAYPRLCVAAPRDNRQG